MNENLKELLVNLDLASEMYDFNLKPKEITMLLHYFNKLQKENKRLNNIINELKNELKIAFNELEPNELVIGKDIIENTLNLLKELKGDK